MKPSKLLSAFLLMLTLAFTPLAKADTENSYSIATLTPSAPLEISILKASKEHTIRIAFATNRNTDVIIRLRNSKNETIFFRKLQNIQMSSELYNFEKVPSGSYTLEVSSPDKTVTQSIRL